MHGTNTVGIELEILAWLKRRSFFRKCSFMNILEAAVQVVSITVAYLNGHLKQEKVYHYCSPLNIFL
jgi:hypothetical protein